MNKIGILLIVAALIALVGCTGSNGGYGGNYEDSYTLTVTSTAGGSMPTPGEGTFTYTEGKVVTLFAVADEGHQFDSWTGDVDTIADVNAALTTITANDDYSIRANFLEGSSRPAGINYTEADAEALMTALINEQRQEHELGTLSEDSLLAGLAKEHSTSMVENDFFGHARDEVERPIDYDQPPGTIRGENLAKIPAQRYIPGPCLSLQEVCEWAVSGWMDSPGHRANILEPRYDETGVGVVFSEEGLVTYLYITQIFQGPA